MHRPVTSAVVRATGRHVLRPSPATSQAEPCDVFINHRGVDTKRNVAGLLHSHLGALGLRPFLDSKSMKPGDRLFEKINAAIRDCRVGIAVFSPMYCDSYFCLHELTRMMELRKRVVPVFCDVKPSDLRVRDDGSCPPKDLDRFRSALDEAKLTVGLTFDTRTGDWVEFLANATDVVIKTLIEVQDEESN
ncbi:Toll-Interleukin-Resistance (TIR) domain family protein [Striga hermonthica]|uniref:Toll-Interleukin-Resistance (TIR) domain family protein n=1 Tax=Striga hermonthica TaxID=68872 RepID=A0A9N7MY93_STRHE|nr:Toll-Interleukin-Resistance (TIR) domain family protein [Striga hermonthica]